jgi:hypothetical protein
MRFTLFKNTDFSSLYLLLDTNIHVLTAAFCIFTSRGVPLYRCPSEMLGQIEYTWCEKPSVFRV